MIHKATVLALYFIFAAAGGYLLGSIPFGIVLTRAAGLGDVRAIGSGNIGATNVLRTGRKDLALATLLLDAGKAAIALLLARWIASAAGFDNEMQTRIGLLAGAFAFLGHCFPIWLNFKGGKGVATFFGVLLAGIWPLGVVAGIVWLAVFTIFRISSLAALCAAAAAPVFALIAQFTWPEIVFTIVLGALIFWRHSANIARLRAGAEPRFSAAKAPAEAPRRACARAAGFRRVTARTLSRPERIAWARLSRTPRIGPLTFHRLMARFKSASAALEALPRLTSARPPPAERIERELDALDAMGARLLAACEPDYPPLLAQLDAPPPLIALQGDGALLARPCIAIVGAREASAAALIFAERLAADLGEAGFAIVSGLARGVDAAAHRGALKTGTAAVLAGGLDQPYPPQNLKLHEAICAHGAVVSEAPLGAAARARDFPRRNNIVSGLSRAVVVVEAALRSGSLITARAAAEQGRDVMAAPGSPMDHRAHGSNALIKQGAALIENADDVIAALGEAQPPLRPLSPGPLFAETPAFPANLPSRIAALLSPTPVHVNDLARLTETSAGAVAAALVELELEGGAASLPGGYAALARAAFSQPD